MRPYEERVRLFDRFRQDFLGLDTTHDVVTLEGPRRSARRIYLDTTATALMPRLVWDGLRLYFDDACANSHTHAHMAGRATTEAIERSRVLVGELFGWDPESDVVIFTGNGATGATNVLADAMFPPAIAQMLRNLAHPASAVRDATQQLLEALRESRHTLIERLPRDRVLVSKMEHHSNMLPWIRAVGYERVRFVDVRPDGTLDMEHLARVLREDAPRVRIVAVTAVSNVTGIANPVHEIAKLAHAHHAEIAIDAAQAAPHLPITMHPADPSAALDHVIVSGHKLYAPGSRGVLVAKRAVFEGERVVGSVGGGAVEYVSTDEVRFKREVTAREEAGTPNIPGTIALGIVARLLRDIGMDVIAAHERELVRYALERLPRIPEVVVYGATDIDRVPRVGVIAFNLRALPHGLVAAALSDFFNIAVRNDCFCAQPYVKEQLCTVPDVESAQFDPKRPAHDPLRRPGMVRASFGVFTTQADVDALADALVWIAAHGTELRQRYRQNADGDYVHRDVDLRGRFSIDTLVDQYLSSLGT